MENLTEKQILQYAIIGISAEISELEKTVRQGKKYLTQYAQGQQPKTKVSKEEIKAIVTKAQVKIEKLDKIKFDLSWKVDVELAEN